MILCSLHVPAVKPVQRRLWLQKEYTKVVVDRQRFITVAVSAAEDDDDAEEVSQHDDHCTVCHKDDDQDMLLCDRCPKAFHLTCLGLTAVPDGDWYCAVCSDEVVNND